MPTPFDNFNLRKATDIIQKVTTAILRANRLFMEGDHWQAGAAWIGPAPEPGDPEALMAMAVIEKGFVSKNVIAEVVERHASGVAGREPNWSFSNPLKEEDPDKPDDEKLEIEEALTEWWDTRGIHSFLQRVAGTLQWAERSSIRLYIPSGFIEEDDDGNGRISADSLEEALSMIYVSHPAPEDSTVYEDPDTKQNVSLLKYTQDRYTVLEMSYLEEDGQTVIRTLSRNRDEEYMLDLGGRLTMHEMKRPLLVTKQVQQAQKALNVALTNIPKTIITSGWLERTLLNAQMPGHYEVNPATGAKDKFVPEPYITGPATTNFVQGITFKDEEGKTQLATPSLQYRDPIPATASIEAKSAHYEDILDEVDQSHVILTQEASPSGRSRVEARLDYVSSLRMTQSQIQPAGKWLLETTLALAEAIMGKPGQFTKEYRCTFRVRLDAGTLDAEEQKVILERVEKGLMPKEWAMELMGVDDVDAALALMRQSPESRLDLLTRQLTALELATKVLSLKQAARLIEFDEEQLAIINEPQDPTTDGRVIEQ